MRESRNLEFKEFPTDSFLKTVSAFANFGGGTIISGFAMTVLKLVSRIPLMLRLELKIKSTIR